MLWIKGRKKIFETIKTSLSTYNIQYSTLNTQYSTINHELQNTNANTIWMHCASLGEFEQGRPLIEKIRLQNPGYRIVITFFSPSGYEIEKNFKGADHVFYLTVDSSSNAEKFI